MTEHTQEDVSANDIEKVDKHSGSHAAEIKAPNSAANVVENIQDIADEISEVRTEISSITSSQDRTSAIVARKLRVISQGGEPVPVFKPTDFTEIEAEAESIARGTRETIVKEKKSNEHIVRLRGDLGQIGNMFAYRMKDELAAQGLVGTLKKRVFSKTTTASYEVADENDQLFAVEIQGGKGNEGQYPPLKNVTTEIFTDLNRSHEVAQIKVTSGESQGDPQDIDLKLSAYGGSLNSGPFENQAWVSLQNAAHHLQLVVGDTPFLKILRATDRLQPDIDRVKVKIDPNHPTDPIQVSLHDQALTSYVSNYDAENDHLQLIHKGGRYKGRRATHLPSFTGEEIRELYKTLLTLVPDNPAHQTGR